MNCSVRLSRSAFPAQALLLALVFAFPFILNANASTVVVGTCKTGVQFSSIQTAIDSVPALSTVYICPGTYAEQLKIVRSITLTGLSASGTSGATASGQNNPVIVPPAAGLAANASDLYDSSAIAAQVAVLTPTGAPSPIKVNLNNLAINGTGNLISGCGPDLVGVYYQNASGTLDHLVASYQELTQGLFGCQSGLAIFVESGYGSGGTAAVTIENSSIHDYQKNGITIDGSGSTATITGNYVVGIGATSLIAQNGIQVSDGASGKISGNTVTDDVYTGGSYSASGILLYDSGGTSAAPLTISTNTVSNTQGAVVAFSDPAFATYGVADYNTVTGNKITASPAAGSFLIDGIDLCSNHNTASNNTVYNSSGAGIHIDSQCTEGSGTSGNSATVSSNTVNEACAGVLLGNVTGNSVSGNITFNVVQVTQAGDSCPVGTPGRGKSRLKPNPWRK